jgi:hypothetical protein
VPNAQGILILAGANGIKSSRWKPYSVCSYFVMCLSCIVSEKHAEIAERMPLRTLKVQKFLVLIEGSARKEIVIFFRKVFAVLANNA